MVIIWYYIRDFFVMIGTTISRISQLVVALVQMIWTFGQTAISIIGVFPSIIITFGTIAIIVMIIFKILGRNAKDE